MKFSILIICSIFLSSCSKSKYESPLEEFIKTNNPNEIFTLSGESYLLSCIKNTHNNECSKEINNAIKNISQNGYKNIYLKDFNPPLIKLFIVKVGLSSLANSKKQFDSSDTDIFK